MLRLMFNSVLTGFRTTRPKWIKSAINQTKDIYIGKMQKLVVLALRITEFQFYVDTLILQTHDQKNLF